LENAPDRIRTTVELLPKDSTVYVKSDIESANLAKKYIDEGVAVQHHMQFVCTLLWQQFIMRTF